TRQCIFLRRGWMRGSSPRRTQSRVTRLIVKCPNVPADPVALARDLLRCPSVTPAEGGALALLARTLSGAGLSVHRVTFSEPGADDVENLYARIGTAGLHLMLAGHTDVVPPGDEERWRHPAFAGEVADGVLFGRGAVDMKGAIACKIAAGADCL